MGGHQHQAETASFSLKVGIASTRVAEFWLLQVPRVVVRRQPVARAAATWTIAISSTGGSAFELVAFLEKLAFVS